MIRIDFEKIKISIHCGDDNVSNFDCKIDDISNFLKDDALEQQEHMLNTTYIAYYNNEILGYYTILADAIQTKILGEEYKGKFANKNISYRIFPALKLGRLGVNQNYAKNGIGTFLLKKVFKHGVELSETIGLRFISIDAHITSYKFYEKCYCKHTLSNDKVENKLNEYKNLKLKNNNRADNITIPMFYDLNRIKSKK